MSNKPEKKGGWLTRCLNGIERVGNSLPHPVILFAVFALAVVVISAPLIVLFLIFRRQIMSGVARGGTKG